MNNDVVQEILLHLPVQSLFRFRAVSKSWRDVIDSPSFRKLHTHNDNSTICLQLNFLQDKQQHNKLSIKLLDNGKSLTSFNLPLQWHPKNVSLVGPIKGLLCIYSERFIVPAIAISNPFLGQFKILPKSPFPQCDVGYFGGERHVGIGFDGDNYKVVGMGYCPNHNHARVYSRRTDSWRDLHLPRDDPQRDLRIVKPVKSLSKNGYFVYWLPSSVGSCDRSVMLTFDMRKEVFRATKIADFFHQKMEILAMDGKGRNSFVVFSVDCNGTMVEIYKKGSDLKYLKPMVKLEDPLGWRRDLSTNYVVLKNDDWRRGERVVFLYDYRAREFVGLRFNLPENSETIEYVGSFISLE